MHEGDEERGSSYDLAVVGGGVAGLTAALTAAAEGARVAVLTKGDVLASASYEAQGGVAAAVGRGDSAEQHARDTVAAGRGLCRESAVRVLTSEAPARIEELRAAGVEFDAGLGLEGGHSQRRVLHVNGAETGRRIAEALARQALSAASIDVCEGERVVSVEPGDGLRSETRELRAPAVLLATGGYAALWSRTTNPPGSTGEGIELAYRAGAPVADLEFVQFHPTALEGGRFLLSEALRGEGALLVDEQGRRFTDELAPRDVVARAVAERGTALLDLRPIDRTRFPSLLQRLAEAGYDPSVDPVPVGAAAHYTMGGVVTDLDGRTDVAGLYAAGECACTGVHGANRLASNSLLECLVFGRRAALAALRDPTSAGGGAVDVGPGTVVTDEIRNEVWEHAGLVRDAAGLEPLRRSPLLLARLLAASALERRESRGGHFRADFPLADSALAGHHTVIRPGSEPVLEPWELTAVDVRAWLAEDVGAGDVTGEAVAAIGARCVASILLKEPGVVSGLAVCEAVFRELDPEASFEVRCADGDAVQPGELARVESLARAVLAGERLSLNLLARLSGVATLTRRYVDAVAGTGATILDTRKTTPGLRALEKEAVRHGGGVNHRQGLYDGVLVKENHIRLAGGIHEALVRAREPGMPVEVECETLAEVDEALAAGVERILLDNMTLEELREAVALTGGRAELEASGGITLDTVRDVAETGVDFISIGALTHSARSLDVSLELA